MLSSTPAAASVNDLVAMVRSLSCTRAPSVLAVVRPYTERNGSVWWLGPVLLQTLSRTIFK